MSWDAIAANRKGQHYTGVITYPAVAGCSELGNLSSAALQIITGSCLAWKN